MTRVLACLVAIALGGVATAQPKPDDVQKAATLYDKGKRHFDIAEYGAAIAAWKEAYLLSSEPLLLFNIAQAHRLSGDCAQANRFYLNYKRVQPKPPNQAELDSAMAKCVGVAPATGDTTPEGTPLPTPTPPEPTPPSPTPIAGQPDQVDTDQGRTLRLSGIAIASAGGVAGVIAIVYALRASDKADQISSQPAGTVWTQELEQIQSDGKAAQTRSRIFAVVGALGVASGAALWWYGRTKSSVKVDLAITPHQTEVSLSCVF
jgi:hypothetical protein